MFQNFIKTIVTMVQGTKDSIKTAPASQPVDQSDNPYLETIKPEIQKPKDIILQPLPNYYSGWPVPADIAIIHYTAGYTAEGCRNALLAQKLSVHECVERDGTIYRYVDHKNRAIHAGNAQWGGQGNMNSRSFGVEVVNFGWGYAGDGSPSQYSSYGPAKDEVNTSKGQYWHRIEPSGNSKVRVLTGQEMAKFKDHRTEHNKKLWSKFTEEQVSSVNWLVWEWIKQNPNIILENVIGHEHVSPGRKTDPGPAWPWRETESYLQSMASKERPELLDPSYKIAERIKAVQSHVNRCGIDVGRIDGIWGQQTSNGVMKLIEKFNGFYELGLSNEDVNPGKCLKLCNAFRLILV